MHLLYPTTIVAILIAFVKCVTSTVNKAHEKYTILKRLEDVGYIF